MSWSDVLAVASIAGTVVLGVWANRISNRSHASAKAIEDIEKQRWRIENLQRELEEELNKSADIYLRHETYHFPPTSIERGEGLHIPGEVHAWHLYNIGKATAKEVRVKFVHCGDAGYSLNGLYNGESDGFQFPGLHPGESVSVYAPIPVYSSLMPIQAEVSWQDATGTERPMKPREIFQTNHIRRDSKPDLWREDER